MVSRLDDSKIIDLFYERSEQAIIELSQKYGSVCTKVANNILNDVRDTEECVNDAYLGAWNTIPPQRPNPLLSYVCRIVRNLAIKKYHANTAAKRNSSYDVALDELENCFPASTSVEDEFNAGEIARSIDRFLETLDKENRIMFVRRYWHSDSIADLRQYAAEHGLTVVDEYIDDGWSGTNFERPSFQRMIDDIEDGKINCVVTKDLSRLGRNYILTGQYTEIYFPSKGVRYIAINDNVDTINGESELAPFLNILNEMHARQTSKKVKAAMHTRFANGAHYGAYAPLGYVKDPDKKGHFLIDPETRWIVEKIFDLAVHGRGAASITRILVEEKVPTPGWLNYERYGTFANIYAGAPAEKAYAWTIAQVKSILKEETYIGHSVHNKQSNISFKNKKKVRKPQEEWYRVENTHEAIISEEVFQKVQELIASRRRKRRNGTTQIFAGLIKCADCGWSLAYGENKQNKNPYGYYHCSKNGQGLRQCSMHYIRYDVLYAYVLARLQYWSMLAQKDEDKLLKRLLNASDRERNSAKKKQAAELKKAEKRKAEVDGLFAKMYEDWSAGRITEYNFNMLSEKYQNEQKELETKIRQLHEMMEAAVQTAADAEKWIALMKQYVNLWS